MARPVRNYDGIQFEDLRRQIDGVFNDLHDSLEEAYYGARDANGRLDRTTGWSAGVSKPWEGFDVRPTPEQSKAQFDVLHGHLWISHSLHFHAENLKQPSPYPRSAYDEYEDDDGVLRSRVAEDRQKLKALRGTDFGTFNKLMDALNAKGVQVDPDATE